MKRIVLLVLLGLAGCALPKPALFACPNVGIRYENPDFYRAVHPQDMEQYYACELENNTRLLNARRADKTELTFQRQSLEYQQSLWRQLLSRQSTAPKAQQEWIQFASTLTYQRAQLKATERLRYESSDHDDYNRYDSRREKSESHESRPSSSNTSSKPDPEAMLNQVLGK